MWKVEAMRRGRERCCYKFGRGIGLKGEKVPIGLRSGVLGAFFSYNCMLLFFSGACYLLT